MSIHYGPLPPRWPDSLPELLQEALNPEAVDANRFARQVLIDPNFTAESAICALDGQMIVGFCLAMSRQVPLENAEPDWDCGYITLFGVHPDYRRRGIGKELLHRAEGKFRKEGKAVVMISPYAPGYFSPGVDVEAFGDGLAFFKSQGYEEVYRPIAMQAPLWSLRVPAWVKEKEAKLKEEGVAFEEFSPKLTLPLLDFAKIEFAGDWVRWVRDAVSAITLGADPKRLITAYVANPDGTLKVLGFSHYCAERYGPIGVALSERGRGIGQVLLYATLQAQRMQGFRTTWFLWSEDRTADRLYTGAGFEVVRRFALLKKAL